MVVHITNIPHGRGVEAWAGAQSPPKANVSLLNCQAINLSILVAYPACSTSNPSCLYLNRICRVRRGHFFWRGPDSLIAIEVRLPGIAASAGSCTDLKQVG